MDITKINATSIEYLPEYFFGDFGAVELKFRIISGSREIFGVAWLNEQFEVTKIKKSKRDEIESMKVLLLDKEFKNFVVQQMELLSEFLQQENAKEFYKKKISLAHKDFEEFVSNRFSVLKEKIKQKLEELEHESKY